MEGEIPAGRELQIEKVGYCRLDRLLYDISIMQGDNPIKELDILFLVGDHQDGLTLVLVYLPE